MSGSDYGRATGQHEQRRQQAELPGCCDADLFDMPVARVDVYFGVQGIPESDDWLRDTIDATFAHANRIEIETWSFPSEESPARWDAQEQDWLDDAGDRASDEERG